MKALLQLELAHHQVVSRRDTSTYLHVHLASKDMRCVSHGSSVLSDF